MSQSFVVSHPARQFDAFRTAQSLSFPNAVGTRGMKSEMCIQIEFNHCELLRIVYSEIFQVGFVNTGSTAEHWANVGRIMKLYRVKLKCSSDGFHSRTMFF